MNKQDECVLTQIMIRMLNCMDVENLYIFGNECNESFPAYLQKRLIPTDSICNLSNELIFVLCSDEDDILNLMDKTDFIGKNTILCFSQKKIDGFDSLEPMGGSLYYKLYGDIFCCPEEVHVPSNFKVLSIVHFYNELDVLKKTTEYLLAEGIDVYLVDNWSTDGSYEMAESLAKKNPGRVYVDRFPALCQSNYFDWHSQLEYTEEISKKLDYNWFIHYDADEMRVSPWKDKSLRDAIYYIDCLGYNLIDNTVIDFRITDENSDSIFMKDVWFEFGNKPGHFKQVKTWKKTDEIDIKTSGGHIAVIDNPRIFPLKILNRHYPLRSKVQAEKKVFHDRKPRFVKEQKERGWHSQYNCIKKDTDFIYDKNQLYKWTENMENDYYFALFMLGGRFNKSIYNENLSFFDYNIEQNDKVVIYGAGQVGRTLYNHISSLYDVVAWVDKGYKKMPKIKKKKAKRSC